MVIDDSYIIILWDDAFVLSKNKSWGIRNLGTLQIVKNNRTNP